MPFSPCIFAPTPHTEIFYGTPPKLSRAERNLQQNDTYFWYNASMTLPVIIYQDAEGWFLGSIPTLQGCRTQAKTLPELYERLNEVALLCMEEEGQQEELRFVGIQNIDLQTNA